MNCCQPRHPGLGEGLQTVVVNGLVLSCNEKVLATAGGEPLTFPLSLVTPLTLRNDPSAAFISPVTSAAKSLLPPTVCGRRPRAGG